MRKEKIEMFDLSDMLKKHQKIAIYGLSNETEKILDRIHYDGLVVGLLDGYKKDGELYGIPIISIQKAIEEQVSLILVVARPGSCKAIARKIGRVCDENNIALWDVRGNDLQKIQKISYDFKNIKGLTKKQIWDRIEKNDVISVDLFDTLIMRQTLFSTDVFELVDLRLKEQEIKINDFCGRRIQCEKELAQKGQVTLQHIYEYMIEKYHIENVKSEFLADMEWKIDYNLLIPRNEVCELLGQARKCGKKIYIISDTYYTRNQLIKILNKCNIDFYTDIFDSCEYGTGKTQGLFQIVRKELQKDSWLHIGDDIVADVENAKKNGINACQLQSSIDLLEMVGYFGLWDKTDKLQNRIKIGMFISKLLNSPFQFETETAKIKVTSAYDLGYLFFAPMITDFIIWFRQQIQKNQIKNVWFGARDGYLIKKMYDFLEKDDEKSVYFLTSRIAAIRAGMENDDDIAYVADMKYSGSLQEQLQERFGIKIDNATVNTDVVGSVLRYSEIIVDASKGKRENYKKYIEKLEWKKNEKAIAFFDFVAKGTSQMYISRLIPNHIKGFYFLRLEEEQMKDKSLDIITFYTSMERDSSIIFDDYYILETMLTAPDPSVLEFDENGEPIYAKETRSKQDIECFMDAQQGIIDYYKNYLRLCPKDIRIEDKNIDEVFLKLIHGIDILDERFLSLNVEDPFFNRMTKITDVL